MTPEDVNALWLLGGVLVGGCIGRIAGPVIYFWLDEWYGNRKYQRICREVEKEYKANTRR